MNRGAPGAEPAFPRTEARARRSGRRLTPPKRARRRRAKAARGGAGGRTPERAGATVQPNTPAAAATPSQPPPQPSNRVSGLTLLLLVGRDRTGPPTALEGKESRRASTERQSRTKGAGAGGGARPPRRSTPRRLR